MMKNIFLLVTLLLSSQSLSAQTPIEAEKLHDFDRKCIDSASVIFEGICLKNTQIPNTNPVKYASIVLVHRVFQGALKAGDTIETRVLTNWKLDTKGRLVMPSRSLSCNIQDGSKFIFLGRISSDQTFLLKHSNIVYEPFWQGNYISVLFKGIFENQEGVCSVPTMTYARSFYYSELRRIIAEKEAIKKPNAARNMLAVNLIGRAINQSFSSGIFEFDIVLQSTQVKYLYAYHLLIDYNTNIFGTNLAWYTPDVAPTNTKLWVINGANFSTSNYDIYSVTNSTSSRLSIDISNTLAGRTLSPIPNTEVVILHIKMKTINATACPGIGSVTFAPTQPQSFYNNSTTPSNSTNTVIYPWDAVTYTANPARISSPCTIPNITSFSPTRAVAGRNILTINGTGFGQPHPRNRVRFRNANYSFKQGNKVYRSVDFIDIINWSETQITVKIPNNTITLFDSPIGPDDTNIALCAGSSFFKVYRGLDSIETTSPTPLQVTYSVNIDNATEKDSILLANLGGTRGAKFKFANFTANSANPQQNQATIDSMKILIKMALKEWQDTLNSRIPNLGITLGIAAPTETCYNTISYSDLGTGNFTGIMNTTISDTVYQSINGQKHVGKYTDIEINSNTTRVKWDLALPGRNIRANRRDFYETIRHELGHFLGINHILPLKANGTEYAFSELTEFQKELMVDTSNAGNLAVNRPTLSSGGGFSRKAAVEITKRNNETVWLNGNYNWDYTTKTYAVLDSTLRSGGLSGFGKELPKITKNLPDTLRVCTGATASFDFTSAPFLAGTGYKWFTQAANQTAWVKINNNNSPSFALTNVSAADDGKRITCQYKNGINVQTKVCVLKVMQCPNGSSQLYFNGVNNRDIILSNDRNITVYYSALGAFNTSNQFTVQLSNSLGSFTSPTTISNTPLIATASSGTISCTVPANMPTSESYRIRIVSTSPGLQSISAGIAICNAPVGIICLFTRTRSLTSDGNPTGTKIHTNRESFQTMLGANVYPNPTSNTLHIDFDKSIQNQSINIQIFSPIGELVLFEQTDKPNNELIISELPNGIYFVKLSANGQERIEKVMINR